MTAFTFMIMNVGTVMYLCVNRCCGQNTGNMAHGACKRLEIFLVCLLQLCRGLSQLYLFDTCSYLGEQVFRSHLFL